MNSLCIPKTDENIHEREKVLQIDAHRKLLQLLISIMVYWCGHILLYSIRK